MNQKFGVWYDTRLYQRADGVSLMLETCNPYTPVSYTHLDVYKRQDR